MRSTKNTRAFAVGVFIFVALVIFIIGVLTLGGQRSTFSDALELVIGECRLAVDHGIAPAAGVDLDHRRADTDRGLRAESVRFLD